MKSPCGFIVVDKPQGVTSHDCVNKLRKIFGIKRIGHGGTLDPSVTGVLPMALGDATRLLRFLPESKKYKGVIQYVDSTDSKLSQEQIIGTDIYRELIKQIDELIIEEGYEGQNYNA